MSDSTAVLVAAADLIRAHGHCKSADARDERGIAVLPFEKSARTWSVTGAMIAAGRATDGRTWLSALVAFGRAVGILDFKNPREWEWTEAPLLARALCERIWEWEERPWRLPEHVLAAFENAINPEEELHESS